KGIVAALGPIGAVERRGRAHVEVINLAGDAELHLIRSAAIRAHAPAGGKTAAFHGTIGIVFAAFALCHRRDKGSEGQYGKNSSHLEDFVRTKRVEIRHSRFLANKYISGLMRGRKIFEALGRIVVHDTSAAFAEHHLVAFAKVLKV